MEEKSGHFGFIKKAWKEVSGQASKERAAVEAAKEQARIQQEQAAKEQAEAKALYEQKREEIIANLAVDHGLEKRIKASGYPNNIVNIDQELTRIDGVIKGRVIYGIFPSKLRLRGKVLGTSEGHDYDFYGDTDIVTHADLRRGFGEHLAGLGTGLRELIIRTDPKRDTWGFSHSEVFKNVVNSNMVSMVNHPNGQDVLLGIFCRQDFFPYGRPVFYMGLYTLLPKEDGYKSLELVKRDSRVAETFIQTTFAGVDETDSRSQRIRSGRATSPNATIIHMDKINPDLFNPHIDANFEKYQTSNYLSNMDYRMLNYFQKDFKEGQQFELVKAT